MPLMNEARRRRAKHLSPRMSVVDFLVVGHLTKDILPNNEWTLGGTCAYAALTAHRLGLHAAIVTSASEEVAERFRQLYPGISLRCIAAPFSSTFENIYGPTGRIQYLRAVGGPLDDSCIPQEWRSARVVHIGPLAQEVSPTLTASITTATVVGVTPQGWMRKWDSAGKVSFTPWASAAQVMAHSRVLVFSEEDVHKDYRVVQQFIALAPIAVVTQGEHGATLFVRGQAPRWCPAFAAKEVDPTGCGDVFAASFMLRLAETSDAWEATNFACCVASFCIEGPGVSAIPANRSVVEERLKNGKRLPWSFDFHRIDVHEV